MVYKILINNRFGGRIGECVSLHVYQAITLWRSFFTKMEDRWWEKLTYAFNHSWAKMGTYGKNGHLKTKQRVDVKNILWPVFKNIDGVYMHVVVEN